MLNIINTVAIVNVLFLFVLLTFRNNNSLPNRILAFLFLVPGLYFVNNLIIINGLIQKVPFIFFLAQIIALAFPILNMKYVYLLVFGPSKRIQPYLLIGSFVLLVIALWMVGDFYFSTKEEQSQYINGLTAGNYPFFPMFYTVVFYCWLTVYYIHSLRSVLVYRRKVRQNLSSDDQSQLNYVQQFIIIFGVLTFTLVVLYLLAPIPIVDYLFLPIFLSVCYFFILFKLIQFNALFTQVKFAEIQKLNEKMELAEERPVQVHDTKLELVHQKLEELLHTELVYLDPFLSLDQLAEKLQTPAYIVSKCINVKYEKSFFDWVNEQRVQHALKLIPEWNEKITLESIGLQAGFNSRASFYRAFKKHLGKTPGDFVSKN